MSAGDPLSPDHPESIRARIREVESEIEALAARRGAGELDAEEFNHLLTPLAAERSALKAKLPPGPPWGARWFAAIRGFCDAYLTFDDGGR